MSSEAPPRDPAAADAPPGLRARVRTGAIEGLKTSWLMVKYTFPLYVAVDILKDTDAANAAGRLLAPAMGLFGLPGNAAFAFLAGFLLNIYAAIAILVPLSLDPWQMTVCGLMLGIAHNLVIEGGVLASAGAGGAILTVCRLALGASAGFLLNALHGAFA